jgi:hypothetical protein
MPATAPEPVRRRSFALAVEDLDAYVAFACGLAADGMDADPGDDDRPSRPEFRLVRTDGGVEVFNLLHADPLACRERLAAIPRDRWALTVFTPYCRPPTSLIVAHRFGRCIGALPDSAWRRVAARHQRPWDPDVRTPLAEDDTDVWLQAYPVFPRPRTGASA